MPRNYWEPKDARGHRRDAELVEDIRQMLADWNAATPEQRAEALDLAAAGADRAEAAMLGLQAFVITFKQRGGRKVRQWVRYYADQVAAEADAGPRVERETLGQGVVVSVRPR